MFPAAGGTFPPPTAALTQVLEAFARLNGDLGYVQGMSYLAAMLLLNMCPFDAWVALNNMLIDNHFFVALFRMNVPGIVQHARIYEMILSENEPDVYARVSASLRALCCCSDPRNSFTIWASRLTTTCWTGS